jgi:hypothetical protein
VTAALVAGASFSLRFASTGDDADAQSKTNYGAYAGIGVRLGYPILRTRRYSCRRGSRRSGSAATSACGRRAMSSLGAGFDAPRDAAAQNKTHAIRAGHYGCLLSSTHEAMRVSVDSII